jgi:TatD family-associated radical SAM protein
VIAYPHASSLYLNITNRCPVACRFCAKYDSNWRFESSDLRLPEGEPPVGEVLAAIGARLKASAPKEIVFCGFGECSYRLELIKEVGKIFKSSVPLRLNTIGLGSLIWGRDIAPELKDSIDAVSVSLNTMKPGQWLELHRPLPAYRRQGFEAAQDFTRRCVEVGLKTRVTAVALPEIDLREVEAFARSIGADFQARPML